MQQPFYSLQKPNMNKKEYRRKNEEFLEEIRKEEGIHELPHGILYRITKSGDGTRDVGPRSIVTCYYRGSLISGKVFDDAWERGYPEAFRVSDLITGFQIALRAMHAGDRWTLYIPHSEAYGTRSSGDIPGCSTLIFDLELISVS